MVAREIISDFFSGFDPFYWTVWQKNGR